MLSAAHPVLPPIVNLETEYNATIAGTTVKDRSTSNIAIKSSDLNSDDGTGKSDPYILEDHADKKDHDGDARNNSQTALDNGDAQKFSRFITGDDKTAEEGRTVSFNAGESFADVPEVANDATATAQSIPITRSPSMHQSSISGVGQGAWGGEGVSEVDENEREYLKDMEVRFKLMVESATDPTNASRSYLENTSRENLLLEHVGNFHRQFTQIYPHRKPLLLQPRNEFNLQKFICTTIRPTQLPFHETYNYQSCAQFVADYLKYEPMKSPHEFVSQSTNEISSLQPPLLPSPTYTLKVQRGNSLECSVLLVSLLRGVGYDAYVVLGYTSRDTCLRDESQLELVREVEGEKVVDRVVDPMIQRQAKKSHVSESATAIPPPQILSDSHEASDPNDRTLKHALKLQRKLQSKFLQRLELKQRAAEQKEKGEVEEREKSGKVKVVTETKDEMHGMRVHAWVLVLPGKRNVAEAFFIESSTGRQAYLDDANYLGIEAVFSSKNYWVNMQSCAFGLKDCSFDLGNNSRWRFHQKIISRL